MRCSRSSWSIVALRGRSFVRLRPDGAAIGMPFDAIGGDWVVSGGPYDARVAPDGLRVAYWFTGHRRFCLPLEPGCSVQDTDVTAYGVPLNAKAKRALARSGRLALRLRVTVRAPGRVTTTARRKVLVRPA